MTTIRVAVPRKGRPLYAVLERVADESGATAVADRIISTLRHEKSITKGVNNPSQSVYDRLAEYSDPTDATAPEYTLYRDARSGLPRRIVFDSVTVPIGDDEIQLVGREEPFRALRKHEFALGFDSADLVLEEVVTLRSDPLTDMDAVNDRINPHDTDVRVVNGLGDTVYHTLLGDPDVVGNDPTRAFVESYTGPLCISPRYERLVEAVLGTTAVDTVEFCYPDDGVEEEAAIADAGLGVYLTVSGSTAREHGLVLGERLFPSETVLLENRAELTSAHERTKGLFATSETVVTPSL
ncbi:hypothetical protein [Halocatena pleomorpha]|uniref:ATP phosphoribosyltransferase n=1 Tax=Halocatena pleomorpha TaxID=1785090 RepID=A0A3P3RJX0_9EURY|nr:hypothetical protein [Halocatena pleomorpha]RRJ33837.1 hypothetical protein EIK79_01645 [Halocatena pleomorpha]